MVILRNTWTAYFLISLFYIFTNLKFAYYIQLSYNNLKYYNLVMINHMLSLVACNLLKVIANRI